jgi:5-methylcytosine-specific restriction endonuclease McrA
MDERELTSMLDAGMSLEKIGEAVERHPSTVSYWLTKYGLTPAHGDRQRARGAVSRSHLEMLVDRGLSIAELACEFDRSKTTIRHWLQRYELKTLQATRRAQRRAAVEEAIAEGRRPSDRLSMTCRVHGDTTFVLEGSGYYRCGRCRSDSVAEHRRRLKALLVGEAGGRCVLCGYDRQPRALEFHHLHPAEKEFALSRSGVTRSLATLRAEASKCVLLCSNCHAEVEDGVTSVPIQ